MAATGLLEESTGSSGLSLRFLKPLKHTAGAWERMPVIQVSLLKDRRRTLQPVVDRLTKQSSTW